MPDVSKSQKRFMAMSKSPKGRARLRQYGKAPAPVSVANEFLSADKGRSFKDLPERVTKLKRVRGK